jgi:purine-nucleoside/S-methyl-5'-thioadenosine phosphorylase / adenosine deaminase
VDLIRPDWPVPPRVRALMSTRNTREEDLRALLPSDPAWLRQVHGVKVVDLDHSQNNPEGDAATTRLANRVCAIKVADCMPVLLADDAGTVIGAAHAGWRGLAAGVIEATIDQMKIPGKSIVAWLGPAIGPKVYEVGDEVREAFLRSDPGAEVAFSPTRPGHWLLDLYTVARQRLRSRGIERVFGGGYCTYSDPQRFYSYRRDGSSGRMAAFLWLA